MAKTLKEKLAGQIPRLRKERVELLKGHGKHVISECNITQAIGGMRGVKGMVCDTSVVEPDKGLYVRGKSILKLKDKLPEEIFWNLMTNSFPTKDELALLQKELRANGKVPDYVWKILKAMPKTSHPMAMLDTAILAMENESAFRRDYSKGIPKTEYWIPTLEDAMRIMGTIHIIAAGVYRIKYFKGKLIKPGRKDMGAEYARMLDLPPASFH